MHIFPALIGKLRRDFTVDKEVLRDWNFPFIHHSYSGCLEASVIIVYCAGFDCNANSSKNKVTCSWFKVPMEPALLKKRSSRRSTAGFARSKKTCFNCYPDQRRCSPWLSWCKISLKQDDVPTLFPVVETMLMPPIRGRQAATRASTTTVHLPVGLKRAISVDTGDVGSR